MSDQVKGLDISREFFIDVVRPAAARICPALLDHGAFGRFGWGSECFGMDDTISRDHFWGPRVDVLLPDDICAKHGATWERDISAVLPNDYKGFLFDPGLGGGGAVALQGLESFLSRTIGRTTPPGSHEDWMNMPEEDIVHVTNGELWEDGFGRFAEIRRAFGQYYPEPVWKRRLAHWCRFASGMGVYALHRAILRDNLVYATTAFGRALKYTLELVFLLNRTYFPYDKWLYPKFVTLPELAPQLMPLVDEAVLPATDFPRRTKLIEQMHQLIDTYMVDRQILRPHPKYTPSETSGFRILEQACAELLHGSPPELVAVTPVSQQIPFETFNSACWVDMTLEHLAEVLCLPENIK